VDQTYDIFELTHEGPVWRTSVDGLAAAMADLKALAASTKNEVRLLHLETKSIVAVMNVPPTA
jgi:hypothetical protein